MRTLISIFVLLSLAASAAADVDNLRDEVGIAIAASETDVAVAKLRQILDLTPEDGATHYQLATLLMDNDGDLFDAASHFERAAELSFQPLGVAYRLSRIYARTGRADDALDQLEAMSSGGFGFLSLVENQPDYESIQSEPRFITALDAIRAARFPCASDERHRAFDFWIGEWNVTSNGQFAGTNNIQPILGHCTLLEEWESANGSFGKSFNYYDPGQDLWRQIWISDSGTFIEFSGEARDDGIFYTAQTKSPADGSITLHKFEFTQLDDGIVRQYWETSTDGGEDWQAIWDGRYEKKLAE